MDDADVAKVIESIKWPHTVGITRHIGHVELTHLRTKKGVVKRVNETIDAMKLEIAKSIVSAAIRAPCGAVLFVMGPLEQHSDPENGTERFGVEARLISLKELLEQEIQLCPKGQTPISPAMADGSSTLAADAT